MPLLNSMPSGHHQVSDAITELVAGRTEFIECKKIDILNEWNSVIESAIVKFYLNWIRHSPKTYAGIYRKFAYNSTTESRSYKYYDLLFMNKIEKILAEEKPDLIICTHSFPSYFINKLKKNGKCSVPCINIYTDFFMNDVWGSEHIDYHFVPDERMKKELHSKYKIQEKHIFITGIPISQKFSTKNHHEKQKGNGNILISGGSTGLGNMLDLLENGLVEARLNFYVLCGTNKGLYQKVKSLNKSNIHPLPYISSKEKINELYNMTDAIVTKPGGVTVTEALKKRIPIFVQSALPGQEEINLAYLVEKKLVFKVPEKENLMHFVEETLNDRVKITEYQNAVRKYNKSFTLQNPDDLFRFIQKLL
jgi:processive 1,2-diacylglycerol beta-glucosyltransferase